MTWMGDDKTRAKGGCPELCDGGKLAEDVSPDVKLIREVLEGCCGGRA